jgi:3-hydroxyisobutyrate dehydrogenase-like beta-hydroxyacid dehydrogenase
MRDLGFIGIGNMGLPMTARLLERGYRVTVFDEIPARVQAAVARGARAAGSAAEVAGASTQVHVCVMYTEQVEQVVFGPGGVVEAGASASLLVDHSTIDVARTRAMAQRLHEATGAGWIDAPVSGGPPSAAEGSLATFVGGTAADVERAAPALAALSRQFTRMGEVGSGLLTKMINQMLVSACFATMAEAARLAERTGLDATRVPAALAGGYADSLLLQRVWPKILARDFTPPAGFAFQLLKDLDLVAGVARAVGVATPVTAQVQTLYRLLVARGHGEADTSALFMLYDERAV